MAGEQHERPVWLRTVHVRHQDRRLAPAGIDGGVQDDCRCLAACQAVAQDGAVRVGDGAGYGGRQIRQRRRRRATPHRRDAHLVQVLVRADVQLPGGARTRGAGGDGGAGDALRHDDVAANVAPGEIRRVALAHIGQRRGQALRCRGQGEGMRDGH